MARRTPAPRTRFTALRGLAIDEERLSRCAAWLGLPSVAGADAGRRGHGSTLALLDGPQGAEDSAAWLPPVAAWIEPTSAPDAQPTLTWQTERAGSVDLYINLTTETANDLHLAGRVLTALAARHPLPPERRDDLELALHEAISNALVHGNLEVAGMKELSATELERFSRDLVRQMANPVLAQRRLEVAVTLEPSALAVEVADEGGGFQPNRTECHGASGRGLDLIATVADSVELKDGGRRIRMRFSL
ncbi:ATP-binding protein [Azospirillum griseum]|uniref:ATP-binding protein n=1 Tax=Azospirillum griseum TaxID=2496639 RepID=A0A431VDJ9_9PROT|nr:ATP-binding protein [Azospirillum griseum]RTR17398.1 ATP-binding protein [Azospirillum griseum]